MPMELTFISFRFHPVFLGGIYAGSGNQPPWALPAKAKYGILDSDRGKKYFQRTDIRTPDFFPFLSLWVRTVLFMLQYFSAAWTVIRSRYCLGVYLFIYLSNISFSAPTRDDIHQGPLYCSKIRGCPLLALRRRLAPTPHRHLKSCQPPRKSSSILVSRNRRTSNIPSRHRRSSRKISPLPRPMRSLLQPEHQSTNGS